MNDIFSLAEGMSLQGGKYTIVRMLSHGGFGVTYLAHHNLLDVDVCIKEFFPAVWCNRDAFSYEVSVSTTGNVDMVDRFMQKFIKEAQSIARLHHEGIVKFHDVFEENGTAYYVMDFIEGQTLQQLVKDRGALPLAEAIGYIRQAAAALGYLHGKRMNHLDVKPANMMIDHSGKLTLIDFGVAKHYGEDGHQTTTTPMCISRGYSPIEQYKDGGVSQFSPAADIYPLGATLYYLLTGTVPPEATELAVDKLIIPDTIPTHIAEAIRHAMESKPSRRTPSAAAFLAEIAGPAQVGTPVAKVKAKRNVQAPKEGVERNLSEANSKSDKKVLIALGTILIVIALMVAGIYVYKNAHGNPKVLADKTRLETPSIVKGNYLSVDSTKTTLVPKETYSHKKDLTGDLITKKGGEYICFTSGEWQKVPDKSAYTKLGVVVNDDTCPAFYVALHDKAGGEEMTWDEAVDQYGESILPSEEQCRAMGNNKDKINNAMRAFGGTVMAGHWYWGKECNSASAWGVGMSNGFVTITNKTYAYRVRPVASVAESAK